MLELSIVVGIILLILLYRKGFKFPTFPKLNIGSTVSPSLLYTLLLICAVIATGYFWQDIKGPIATWLTTSDGGQAMQLQKEVIQKWLWLGVSTLFVVTAILVFKPVFLNNLLTLILLGFFIAMIFYVMTRNDVVQVVVAENGCLTVSQLNDATRAIDEKGRCINVKASDKPFTLTTNKNGYAIRMVFHKGELELKGLPDNSFSYAYVDTTTRALDGVQNFTPVKSQFTQRGVESINFKFFATEVK